MDKLYNEDIKERYIEERFGDNEGSQKTIRNLFYKSEMVEDILQKDLYNFNLIEIGKVIQNMNPYSNNVAGAYFRTISRYISWAIGKGLRDDNISPMKGIKSSWADQFVDHTKKVHFSYQELNDMVEKLNSAQDIAFIWLMFEGVQGNKFSEIRKLNYSTVNWDTNELLLEDEDGSKRTIKVSDQCMRYIENAYKTETTMGEKEKEIKLVRSDFIIRNVYSPRSKAPDVSMTSLYNRMYRMKEKLNLSYFTGNGLRQSGMIWKAVQIYERDKSFGEYKQFEEIGLQFDYATVNSPSGEYFNTSLMREFINSEKIKELYDLDIEF
jgi:integrase